MLDKGYIIVNLPKDIDRCNGCDYLYYSDGKVPTCNITEKVHPYYGIMTTDDSRLERPEYCPINEFPGQKYHMDEYDDWERGYCAGYNVCLEEIKGEQENYE